MKDLVLDVVAGALALVVAIFLGIVLLAAFGLVVDRGLDSIVDALFAVFLTVLLLAVLGATGSLVRSVVRVRG